MTHRWRVGVWAGAILLAAAASPTVTGQAPRDALRVTVVQNTDGITAGDSVAAYLTVEGAAAGPVSVLADGLGVLDNGFVQKIREVSGTWCPPRSGCGPCPQDRRCFSDDGLVFRTDVRAALGRHTVPITVTDSLGRTARASVALTVLPALDDDGDGMPDDWEFFYFSYSRNALPEFAADADADGDGVSNIEEFRRGTNPRARVTRYFAEASSGDRPPAHLHSVDVAGMTEGVNVFATYIGDEGRRVSFNLGGNAPFDWVLPAGTVGGLLNPADRVVAVIVETTGPAIVQRRMDLEDPLHETALRSTGLPMAGPATRWLFADGGTDGTLDEFFLAYNPGSRPVEATITYRTNDGAIARQSTRAIMPGTRTTIWTNVDDAPLGRVEASAEITATGPILVERAWRFDPPGRTVTQAYASPGTDDASSRWIFPDVDGTAAFDTAIVVANPSTRDALIDVNYLYSDREPLRGGQLRIPPHGRVSIPARQEIGLAGRRASVELLSANGVRVIADRTMSGRDANGSWRHATIGARASAARWAFAVGSGSELVLTNVSSFAAKVDLHFAPAYSHDDTFFRTIEVPARGRFVYPMLGFGSQFPSTSGTLRITCQPTSAGTAEIVAEELSHLAVGGVEHARTWGVLATPLP